jgi:hypothetical protein
MSNRCCSAPAIQPGQRARERRNFLLAWTMAAEVPKVPSRTRYRCCCWRSTSSQTAAPRWHARLCAEVRLTLPEAQLALAALHALAGPGAIGGGQALVAVCSAHGLDDAVGILDAWLDARDH